MHRLSAEQRGGAIYADSDIESRMESYTTNKTSEGVIEHERLVWTRPTVNISDSSAGSMEWTGNRGCQGGAVATNNAILHMKLGDTSHSLLDNKASDGGFLFSLNSEIKLTDVTLSNNAASPELGCGGHILAAQETVILLKDVVVTNGASRDGGAMCLLTKANATLETVTIEDCVASVTKNGMGGGLYVAGGADVEITKSVVRRNRAVSN